MNSLFSQSFFRLKSICKYLPIILLITCKSESGKNQVERNSNLYYSFNPVKPNLVDKKKDTNINATDYYWNIENCSPHEQEFNEYLFIITKGLIIDAFHQTDKKINVVNCYFYDEENNISNISTFENIKPLIFCSYKDSKIRIQYNKSRFIEKDSTFFIDFNLSFFDNISRSNILNKKN